MLPASATTVLAVPDRPAAERPESPDPDASDGRFAGLMAQFVQVRREPPPPDAEKSDASPSRSRTEAPSEPGASRPEAPESSSRPKAETADAPATQSASAPPATTPSTPGTPQAQAPSPTAVAILTEVPIQAAPLASPGAQGQVPVADAPAASPLAQPLVEAAGLDPEATIPAALASVLSQPSGPKAPKVQGPVEAESMPTPGVALRNPAAGPAVPKTEESPSNVAALQISAAKPPEHSAETIPAIQAPVSAPETAPAMLPMSAIPGTEAEPLPLDASTLRPAVPLLAVQNHPGAATGAALAASAPPSQTGPSAAIPAPVAPAPPPPAPAVIQVDGSLRWMLKGGSQEARLQLHPESLGQVTIHLKVEGGEVHARLWITEPASVQAVQEGRSHLEQSLKEQGLQLGSFDLQQGHRPFQEAPSAPLFRGQPGLPAQAARQEAPAPPPPSILNTHHVELYA